MLEAVEKIPDAQLPAGHPLPHRNPPSSRYCRFYRDYGHSTYECYHRKNEIERLIRAGHLQEFVYRERRNDRRKEQPGERGNREGEQEQGNRGRGGETGLRPPGNIIKTISGGLTDGASRLVRKALVSQIRALQSREVYMTEQKGTLHEIIFDKEDRAPLETWHNDPLVIKVSVAEYNIKRVLVDTGSSVDILFYECYAQMDLGPKGAEIMPVEITLYDFAGNAVAPLGQVSLPMSLGEGTQRAVQMVGFVLVDPPSAYNAILVRPILNNLRAVVSTHCMKMKFPIGDGVNEVKGDQAVARSCYVQSVGRPDEARKARPHASKKEQLPSKKKPKAKQKGKEVNEARGDPEGTRQVLMQPEGETLQIKLVPGQTGKKTRIGAQLEEEVSQELIAYLRRNVDVFAWSPAGLVGIDPQVITHSLHVNPRS